MHTRSPTRFWGGNREHGTAERSGFAGQIHNHALLGKRRDDLKQGGM